MEQEMRTTEQLFKNAWSSLLAVSGVELPVKYLGQVFMIGVALSIGMKMSAEVVEQTDPQPEPEGTEQTFELLPDDGYSKSDCRGFFKHEKLSPYAVGIDTFKVSRAGVNPLYKNRATEDVILLMYRGQIESDDTDLELSYGDRPIVMEFRKDESLYSIKGVLYKTSTHNPFTFLKQHRDIELADTIENIDLVVHRDGVTYEKSNMETFEFKRFKFQPVLMCITFDLTKLEKRKSTATKQSFAFFLDWSYDLLHEKMHPSDEEAQEAL